MQGVFELLEFQKFLFPTLALCGGLILHALGVGEAAILMVYCGAQAGGVRGEVYNSMEIP